MTIPKMSTAEKLMWAALAIITAFSIFAAFSTPASAQDVGTYYDTTTQTTQRATGVVVVNSDGSTGTQGNVAAGTADSGAPIKIGGYASNTTPTAVTAGQRQNAWLDLNGSQIVSTASNAATTDGIANTVFGLRGVGAAGCCFNLGVMPYYFNGTTWDRQRGDTNGHVVQPALSANYWNYAAASGGIVNTTTAVTIKAAAGAGVRNYLCSLNYGHDTLGAVTELAIRDGAAGTVLFRAKLQTTAREGDSEVTFSPCLKGTANTLLEVVTLTATVSGGVFVNASGYTGS